MDLLRTLYLLKFIDDCTDYNKLGNMDSIHSNQNTYC